MYDKQSFQQKSVQYDEAFLLFSMKIKKKVFIGL